MKRAKIAHRTFVCLFVRLFNLRQATMARSMATTMKRVMKLLSRSKRRSPWPSLWRNWDILVVEHDLRQHRKEIKHHEIPHLKRHQAICLFL